jgi:hypothetical protein
MGDTGDRHTADWCLRRPGRCLGLSGGLGWKLSRVRAGATHGLREGRRRHSNGEGQRNRANPSRSEHARRTNHIRKPRFGSVNRDSSGNTTDKSPVGSPYQVASVAAYCSTDDVGIQRPRVSVSLGPPSCSVG